MLFFNKTDGHTEMNPVPGRPLSRGRRCVREGSCLRTPKDIPFTGRSMLPPLHSNLPIADLPIGDRPIGDLPIGDRPIAHLPIGDRPIGDLPIGDLPIGHLHTGHLPIGDLPR